MRIHHNLALALLAGLLLLAGSAVAQQPVKTTKQLAGRWQIVSVTLEQDGNKSDYFGPNPQGVTIFDGTGHFVRVLSRSDLPKFASNNRAAGTPEENKAVVQGSIGYAGTYTYNAADKNWTLHIEETTFPNWLGVDQKRVYTLTGDELREINPVPSIGSGKVLAVWKRVH